MSQQDSSFQENLTDGVQPKVVKVVSNRQPVIAVTFNKDERGMTITIIDNIPNEKPKILKFRSEDGRFQGTDKLPAYEGGGRTLEIGASRNTEAVNLNEENVTYYLGILKVFVTGKHHTVNATVLVHQTYGDFDSLAEE
jgi:hypothetical protein